MSVSSISTHSRRNGAFLYHLGFGALICILAIYLIVTGEYGSLAERKQTESMLNLMFMLGGLYAVASWFAYMFLLRKDTVTTE